MKDIGVLYDQMNDLLALATALVGEEFNSPEEALETLEDGNWEEPEMVDELIGQIYDLIDEIDAVEAEDYYGEIEENYKPMKKIVKLTEADLTRIVKKVIKEQADIDFDVDNPRGFGSTYDEVGDYRADIYGDGRMFDRYDRIDNEYNEEDWEDWYEVGGDPEADDYDEYLDSPVGKDPKSRWSSNIPGRNPNISRGDDGPRKWWDGEKRSRLNRTGSSALRVKRPRRRN